MTKFTLSLLNNKVALRGSSAEVRYAGYAYHAKK